MDFIHNIHLDQLVDIGFGLLVAGICIKTLFTDRNALKKQRELWRQELGELENSLKSLITDASDASEIFDKNIRHRQKELAALLEKVEHVIQTSNTTAQSSDNSKETAPDSRSFTKNSSVEDPPWVHTQPEFLSVADKVQSSLEDASKRSSLRHKTLATQGKHQTQAEKIDKTLALKHQIEIEKQEQEKADNEIFQQTSIVDQVAFRIAKRLLLEGKELHVVARKLELPVSEIRHLDTLLREQAQRKNLPLPKALEEKEIRRVRGIVRNTGTTAKENDAEQKVTFPQEDTETLKDSSAYNSNDSELF
jgi:hypothetical protein